MRLMQKLFGRIYMDEMSSDGGAGGGGDSGGSSGSDQPLSSSTPSTTAPAPASEPSDGEPKTMLEAISQSLESKSGKEEGGPGEAGPKAEAKDQKPGEQQGKAGEQGEQMPEGLSPRAQERFRELSSKVKEYATQNQELTLRVQQFEQNATPLINSVQQFFDTTGATPQQMNTVAAYLTAVNNGDLQTEANMLIDRLREIQLQTGQQINVGEHADPLSQFPDLAEAVAGYQITREHALEIARGRAMQAESRQQQEQQQARDAETGQWISTKAAAINSLREWEQGMASKDPDYAAIAPMVMGNKDALKWIVENTPPQTWHQHMTMLYNQAKAVRSSMPRNVGGDPRPLSGGNGKPPNSGVAPKTMFEAMFPGG